MTRRVIPGVLALILVVANVACQDSQRQASIRATVNAWLSCEECERSERAAVTAFGDDAIGLLDSALIGPTSAQTANIDSQTLRSYGFADTSDPAAAELVRQVRENFASKHQQRAAMALGDIGTPRAIEALERARDAAEARGYRKDVVRVIESALAAGGFRRYHGAIAVPGGGGFGPPNTARFGDTVYVRRDTSGPAWNGDETVALRGAPYPNEVFLERLGDSVIKFFAFAEPGAYTIELGRLGTGSSETQVAPLRINSSRPAVRGPGPGPSGPDPLIPADFPVTKIFTLGAHPADTAYYYEIQTNGPLNVRASVESAQSLETASILWLDCSNTVVNLGSSVLRGSVVNQDGAGVPNANVSVAGYSPATMTGSAGEFSLALPPAAAGQRLAVRIAAVDYRLLEHRIQTGATEIRIGLVRSSTQDGSAIPRLVSTVAIPASTCRRMQVGIPGEKPRRIVRLLIESP